MVLLADEECYVQAGAVRGKDKGHSHDGHVRWHMAGCGNMTSINNTDAMTATGEMGADVLEGMLMSNSTICDELL